MYTYIYSISIYVYIYFTYIQTHAQRVWVDQEFSNFVSSYYYYYLSKV